MDDETSATGSALKLEDVRKGYQLRCQMWEISKGLKLYEKISAIFLLCKTPLAGLVVMEEILRVSDSASRSILFFKWLEQLMVFTDPDWREKLAELLATLRNYRLAKALGFTKELLMEKFPPKNYSSTNWISVIRKALYNLCEELNLKESSALIANIEGNYVNSTKEKYLEYKLLQWSEKNIIYLGSGREMDLVVLIKYLESVKLKSIANDIAILVCKINCMFVRDKTLLISQAQSTEFYEVMDKSHLGLCVIINEKSFTSSLFPKRLGSDKDVERLTEVFTAFGFDIKLHVNLTFKQLINILKFYAKTVDRISSFFILIILSHGSENVIYTSDSLPIDMNTIEMIFQAENCPNLLGKPKIFIVQSCQGEKWQRVMADANPDVQVDTAGVSMSKQPVVLVGPQRGDSMIAWSTVQGFASFRDKHNGSWYIEELCSQLWKFGDAMDLVEILTKVNNNLRSKVYGGQFMVPSLLLSLRAKVQFLKLNETFKKGKKLMFERLIFEKSFKEFLTSSKCSQLKLVIT